MSLPRFKDRGFFMSFGRDSFCMFKKRLFLKSYCCSPEQAGIKRLFGDAKRGLKKLKRLKQRPKRAFLSILPYQRHYSLKNDLFPVFAF